MDSKLKSSEDRTYYELDEWFIEKLRDFPMPVGVDIARQLDLNFDDLNEQVGWTQKIGGVSLKKEPVYFEIEFLKQPDEHPIFVDVNEIEVDDYLDYMIEKNTLKSNTKYVQKQS